MKTDIFFAYLVTNKINQKIYVGITSKALRTRWYFHVYDAKHKKSNSALHAAIRKYGAEAFEITPLASARTWEDICDGERKLIAQYNSQRPRGYNLTLGGEGTFGIKVSAETRRKQSLSAKGKKHTPESRKNMSVAQKKSFAENHERREACAARLRSMPPHTEETKRKLSIAHTGKKLSPEHIAKLSASLKGRPTSARQIELITNLWKGKKLSAQHVQKLSESHKGKKQSRELVLKRVAPLYVSVLCDTDGLEFESVRVAANFYGIDKSCISSVLIGRQKQTHGLTFSYLNPDRRSKKHG